VNDFLQSNYEDADKEVARVLAEATLVGGKDVFNWLKEVGDEIFEEELSLTRVFRDTGVDTVIIGKPSKRLKKGSYVTLIDHLSNKIGEFDERYKGLSKSPEDYLIEVHKVPGEVAERIVETTRHTIDTVIRATDDTKKNMIGAFKGLASFLHINLEYPLDEAIAKTIEMFKNDEATTINQTLYHGSKEVFARFEEYRVPREFTIALVDKLINDGSDYARLYAERFPQLLDFSQRFGPNGWNFLGNVLRDRGLTYTMLNQNGVRLLNNVYEKDPSSFPALLENLLKMDWSFEKSFSNVTPADPTEAFQKLPYKLSCDSRAKLLTMAIVADSIRSDIGNKLFRGIPIGIQFGTYRNIISFLQAKHDQLKNKTDAQAVLEQEVQHSFERIRDKRKLLEQGEIKKLPNQ
jgi:hypothetical protein